MELGHPDSTENYNSTSGIKPLFRGGTCTVFEGKTNSYIIDTYYSNNGNRTSFLEKTQVYGELIESVTKLYTDIYPRRNRELSLERVRKNLSYPRTILMLARYRDELVGCGIFPRLLIPTDFTTEPVVYSSRTFRHKHEGQGLGTYVLGKAIELHQEEVVRSRRAIRYGALMTHNPQSVASLEKLPSVGEIFPFEKSYEQNREEQQILLGIHKAVYIASPEIDINGVSRHELWEQGMNETYRPTSKYTRAYEIYEKMISPRGLRMNREAGDVVYVIYKLKKAETFGKETPLKDAA